MGLPPDSDIDAFLRVRQGRAGKLVGLLCCHTDGVVTSAQSQAWGSAQCC